MNLTASKLYFGYDKALNSKEFSYSFEKGKVYVLIGDNGIGKTTLMKTLAGILAKVKGEVKMIDSVGFMATNRPSVDYLKVEEYLEFGGIVFKEDLIKEFNLDDLLSKYVTDLSDGQFRKVALLRQLLKNPSLLILDEPSAFLDLKQKDFLVALIKKIKMDRVIILSSHDQDFITKVNDEIIDLNLY